jgi:mono/diheme cytochrome c family protein
MNRNKKSPLSLGIVILSLSVFAVLSMRAPAVAAADATPWVVPASAKNTKNPVAPTPKNKAEAKGLYTQNCVPCHGDQGDGQGLMGSSLDPPASNFTDAGVMGPQTDGELFWKMGEGRSAMPAFKDQLNDTQRWELVNYLRTFAKPAAAKKSPAPKSQN